MLFVALAMGALTGYLTDAWLARAGVKDPVRLFVALAVFVLVTVLVDVGSLSHF